MAVRAASEVGLELELRVNSTLGVAVTWREVVIVNSEVELSMTLTRVIVVVDGFSVPEPVETLVVMDDAGPSDIDMA